MNSAWAQRVRLTNSMNHHTKIGRLPAVGADLERLKRLERRLIFAPAKSIRHRELNAAIRHEADAYRKSLDLEQAMAMHDAKPLAVFGRRPLNRTSRN